MTGSGNDGPTWDKLFSLFPDATDLPRYEVITAREVPSPSYQLLVHDEHMTLTVEAHHGDFVRTEILHSRRDADFYARMILLRLQATSVPVQFGIVRVDLAFCSDPVRESILAGKTPFGRILIEHNVLRRIEPVAFLRVFPSPATRTWFLDQQGRVTYGRLAYIHCDGRPAVELLEIVAPEAPR